MVSRWSKLFLYKNRLILSSFLKSVGFFVVTRWRKEESLIKGNKLCLIVTLPHFMVLKQNVLMNK